MKIFGIRFYPTSIPVDSNGDAPIFLHGTVEDNRSDFDLIFEPFYSMWEDFVFLDDDRSIRIFDSKLSEEEEESLYAEMDSYILDSRKNGEWQSDSNLVKSSIFQKFGKYVYEFEGGGFCLLREGTPLDRALEIDHQIWAPERLEDLPEEVICLIQNWDGVFWQIFTKEVTYLQKLCAVHGNSEALPAYWVELSKDFPNPRGSSPEDAKMVRVEQAHGEQR